MTAGSLWSSTAALLRGLDPGELARAWRRYELERTVEVRDELVALHRPLVRFVGRRLSVVLPAHASWGPLLIFGEDGLTAAIEAFDRAGGIRFETYAMTRIRAAMIDQLRALGELPCSWFWLEHLARRSLETRLGRSPDYGEVRAEAEMLRDGPQDPVQIPQSTIPSFDELWNVSDTDIDRMSLLDSFPEGHGDSARTRSDDGRDALTVLTDALSDGGVALRALGEQAGRRDWIAEAIMMLEVRDRVLAYLYYYENMRVLDIGGLISIASGRIPQRVGLAVLRLRSRLESLPGTLWSFAGEPAYTLTLYP